MLVYRTPADLSSLSDEPIKLAIGDPAQYLYVHSAVVSRSSEFFKTAIKKEWLQFHERCRTIEMPDDDIEDVTAYVQWLYSDILVTKHKIKAPIDVFQQA